MARKSKRTMLNEAIRQGQAKIAEGLKTGYMRSDYAASQAGAKDNKLDLDGIAPGRGGLLKSKEKSEIDGFLSNKWKLLFLLAFVVLVLGVWLITALRDSAPSEIPDTPTPKSPISESAVPENSENDLRIQQAARTDNVEIKTPVAETPKGDNVIWITSIEISRQNELVPLRNFFNLKGIPTEIIGVGDRAALVTQTGFERNPAARGTEGYELFLRIKQFGPVYVEETKDTKFGEKPFQDAYGYKR
jgi:hypothetical protein